MEPLQEHARAIVAQTLDELERSLPEGDERAFARRIAQADLRSMRRRQGRHLRMLLEPSLDAAMHWRCAERLGRMRALAGVDVAWMLATYKALRRVLWRHLDASGCECIAEIIDARLLTDIRAQGQGERCVARRLSAAAADIEQHCRDDGPLTDVFGDVLRTLHGLQGLGAAFIGSVRSGNRLEIEAVDGPRVPILLEALRQHHAAPPTGIPGDADAQGPLALACTTGCIQVVDGTNPALATRRRALAAAGMRSESVVPLLGGGGEVVAVLAAYSAWSGFFSGARIHEFLKQLQFSLGQAVFRRAHGRVWPPAQRKHFAALLRQGRVRMLYQPIIGLTDGRVLKVEALARLLEDDATLLSPALFLPALGPEDMLSLLHAGVRQVCADQLAWAARGLDMTVALNLPPQAMADRRFHEVLFSTLEECRADTSRIEMEILESPVAEEAGARELFFSTLRTLGIRVVEDDLGAGYSSLLRMESIPFDGVKIDQGLVLRAARRAPHRALEFVHHLTQLAHALRVDVTVEGLEHEGLIEACAILGADAGQGFAIARPMPAHAVPGWVADDARPIDPQHPRSALGALAFYMLWDRQLAALRGWPGLLEDFIASPCALRRWLDGLDGNDRDLRQLFDANRAFALQGSSNRLYQRTRERLVHRLGSMWLESIR